MKFRFAVGVSRIFQVVPVLMAVVAAQSVAAHSELRGSISAVGAVLDCAPA